MMPPGMHLAVAMPCKPSSLVRDVSLGGRLVSMTMLACSEDGVTYSVGTLKAGDPADVVPVLEAMARAAHTNLQARVDVDEPASVPGMTPNGAARLQRLSGRMPDGRAVQERLVLFAHGTRVYQAIVLAAVLDAEKAHAFTSSLKVLP